MTIKKLRGSQMNLKAAATLLAFLMLMTTLVTPAISGRTNFLSVCQELMNQARTYEARASYHGQVCKALMQQIENVAKQPKNDATIAAIDQYFAQYDENRSLEQKFRELYMQATEDAKQCMKSAD
jgi:thiol-disulfide isomerase/thioredoxin